MDSCDLWAKGCVYAKDNRAKQTPNDLAKYLTEHLEELGLSYVIWAQRIWVRGAKAWRPMEDRGSITANHWDHVHITFKDSTSGGGGGSGGASDPAPAPDARCKAVVGNCQTTCTNGRFRTGLCPGSSAVRCCIPNPDPAPSTEPAERPAEPSAPTPTPPQPSPSAIQSIRNRAAAARDWLKSKLPFVNEGNVDEAGFDEAGFDEAESAETETESSESQLDEASSVDEESVVESAAEFDDAEYDDTEY
jgi:hypothetical protein